MYITVINLLIYGHVSLAFYFYVVVLMTLRTWGAGLYISLYGHL